MVYLRCDRRFRKLDMNINRFKIWAVVASFAITAPIFAEGAPNAEEDKKLYDANNCGSCHALDKKLVGPALRGVHERHSEEWLIKWVRNNKKLRESGDAEAIKLYNDYGGAAMNIYENLTPAQVLDIVEYIKTAPAPAAPKTDGPAIASDAPVSDPSTKYILLILVAVFAIVLIVLARVRNTLKRIAAEANPD